MGVVNIVGDRRILTLHPCWVFAVAVQYAELAEEKAGEIL